MKIVRYFLQEEWEATGDQGFSAMWVPKACGFDPGGAMLMAHDMLEHRMMDRGRFHEELMAFGRVMALRTLPGHCERGFTSPEYGMGSELSAIWADADADRNSALGIPDAPPTELDGHPEWFITRLIAYFKDSVVTELESRHDDPGDDHALTARFATAMHGWLRIGYLDALRRYGSADHGCYDVGLAMVRWYEKKRRWVERVAEEEPGCVMRLEFDTQELRFKERIYTPNEDTGAFPGWLRQKIYWYRNARSDASPQ